MTDRRLTSRLAAVLLALVLVAAACGDDSGGEATDDTAVPTASDSTTTTAVEIDPAEGAQSPSASVRADLTSLLQEHVYLVGLTVAQGVADGTDVSAAGSQPVADDAEPEATDTTQAAADSQDAASDIERVAGTVEENSADLAAAIGSVYGLVPGEAFLAEWEAHVNAFFDYASARAEGDEAAATTARADLESNAEELGDLLASVNDEVTTEGFVTAFQPHIDTMLTAIDGLVAADPAAWSALREAAQVTPDIALVLAEAIATQQRLDGDVEGPGSDLRADLTNLLQEDVYLAGAAVGQVLETGDAASPDAAGALAALDESSVALSQVMGELYGDEAGAEFLTLWQSKDGLFVDYALAMAAEDTAAADAALEGLHDVREEIGEFVESNNELLSSEAVAAELQPHVDTFIAAIDAAVELSPERFEDLRVAAQVMPVTALTLAGNLQIDA